MKQLKEFHKNLFQVGKEYFFLNEETLKPVKVEPYVFHVPRWLSEDSGVDKYFEDAMKAFKNPLNTSFEVKFRPSADKVILKSIFSGMGVVKDYVLSVIACPIDEWEYNWSEGWDHLSDIMAYSKVEEEPFDMLFSSQYSYVKEEFILVLFKSNKELTNRNVYRVLNCKV